MNSGLDATPLFLQVDMLREFDIAGNLWVGYDPSFYTGLPFLNSSISVNECQVRLLSSQLRQPQAAFVCRLKFKE